MLADPAVTLRAEARRRIEETLARKREQQVSRDPYQYAGDPVGFITKLLGEQLWDKLVEICVSVRDNRRTAVQSCHDIGKSFIAARLIAWWVSTVATGDAFALTSAPTKEQVEGILWRELGRAHDRGDLPGRISTTSWHIDKELVAIGRKPRDTNPTGMQGYHASRMLVVFDEACGMALPLWTGAEGLMTNAASRWLVIGNPDDPSSKFAEVCKPGSGWNVIKVSVFDSPNFRGGVGLPQRILDQLVTPIWVEEAKLNWGEDHPSYIAKVKGEFPPMASDALINPAMISAAIARRDFDDDVGPIELGVDCARGGGDEAVIALRVGRRARIWGVSLDRSLMTLCGRIVTAAQDTGATRIKIDDSGLGGGVTDRLLEIKEQTPHLLTAEIVPVIVGEAPTNPGIKGKTVEQIRFGNYRAELHWMMRTRFHEGIIQLERDDKMSGQFVSLKFKNDSVGRIWIPRKEEMKATGLKSPDRAEAIMLAFTPGKPILGQGFLDMVQGEIDQAQTAVAERWTLKAPQGVNHIGLMDGRLVAVDENGLIHDVSPENATPLLRVGFTRHEPKS